MSGTTLRIIIAAVLFIHGVGHSMGVMPALRLVDINGWNSRSWLLTPILGETASRILSIVLFLAALAGFADGRDSPAAIWSRSSVVADSGSTSSSSRNACWQRLNAISA